MRDIRFRAWDSEKNQMVNVRAMDWYKESGGVVSINYPNGKIYDAPEDFGGAIKLMQYTGLKDKNGVEIYEGDILKFPDSVEGKYEVKFLHGCWIIGNDKLYGYSDTRLFELEVIGNIYSNPELLEQEK